MKEEEQKAKYKNLLVAILAHIRLFWILTGALVSYIVSHERIEEFLKNAEI